MPQAFFILAGAEHPAEPFKMNPIPVLISLFALPRHTGHASMGGSVIF